MRYNFLPILLFILFGKTSVLAQTVVDEPSDFDDKDEILISTPSTPLPCAFSWANVIMPDGTTEDFMEDKGCQPFRGPCVAFSLIKVMEAQLNINSEQACRPYDFSIPWLEYAEYYTENMVNYLDGGGEVPVDGCGNFPTSCENLGQDDDTCDCVKGMVNDVIGEDHANCFEIVDITPEPGQNQVCEQRVSVNSVPLPAIRMSANSVSFYFPSSISALKQELISNGPLAVVIFEEVLTVFRDYPDVENQIAFHSVALTGWEDQLGGVTKWLIDDHWPEPGFCGPDASNVIDDQQFMAAIQNGYVRFIKVSGVTTTENCVCERVAFNFEDQTNCNPDCSGEPVPIITGLTINNIETNCITRGEEVRVEASMDCGNLNPGDMEVEWEAWSGGVQSTVVEDCGAYAIVHATSLPSLFIQARARFSANCPWSPWYVEEFCVQATGGQH